MKYVFLSSSFLGEKREKFLEKFLGGKLLNRSDFFCEFTPTICLRHVDPLTNATLVLTLGSTNETDIQLEKKMEDHDSGVHRFDDGHRYRGLRCQQHGKKHVGFALASQSLP
jgi:hypothetical protein